MDNDTKVMLSLGELAIANDKNIILTKKAIIEKAAALFNNQIPVITNVFKEFVKNDEQLIAAIPKISKGENYNGFPYLLMDYPTVFGKENIFAIRTMFWWGNFFSITLHLKGMYKEMFTHQILSNVNASDGFYIFMGENEWHHHFEDNYLKIAEISEILKHKIVESSFLKIALKYELHHWNMMQSLLPEGYKKIINLFKV